MNITLVLHKYGISVNDPCCYPLGFMYVSSVLKQQNHNVKVLNYNLWDYDFDSEIKGSDYVYFTGFEEFKPYIVRDAAICKELGVITTLGGALATFCSLEMEGYVDNVLPGEFEKMEINQIPFPDYEGFGVSEYHRRHDMKYMGVLSSRGCPYCCTFCAQTCKFRYRSLSNVFSEIDEYRAKYGVEMVVFNDNTLNVRRSRFMAICEGMKKRGLLWSAAIRADKFDNEMAVAFKNSGGSYFVVGVESFDQKRLDMMHKKIKADRILRTLDVLEKHKIKYHGNIILGMGNESASDIVREINEMPRGYNLFPVLYQPFIGTSGKSTLPIEQRDIFNKAFIDYANSKAMTTYPVVN